MADQNPAATETEKAVTEAAPAVEAAEKAAASPQEKSKRTRRAASVRTKADKPARGRPVGRKSKPAAEPIVATQRKPRRNAARRNQGADIMSNFTNNGTNATAFNTDGFRTVFGDVNERAKVAAERSAKIVEEMTDLTRGNVEAFVTSSKVAAKAVETLSQDVADYSRKSFEEASSALKTMVEVKSPTDFFRVQSDFARSAFDSMVAESARFSENMLKIAGDVAQPITNRYTVAAERVKTLAA